MKSKIIYNADLSISQNAKNNGVTDAAIRAYIRRENINRRYDEYLKRYRVVHELRKSHPNWTIREISDKSGISLSSVKRYLKTGFKIDNFKVSILSSNSQKFVIKSISYDQSEILTNILRLYVKTDTFDCDLTASIGVFYKNLPKPALLFDKYPQMDGVLPLEEAYRISEGSLNSVIFDLPFLVKTENAEKSSKMAQRFDCFRTEDELFDTNTRMLELSYRLLKRKGFLIVKTMDICCNNTTQIWLQNFVQNNAREIGFVMRDLFILIAKSRNLKVQPLQQHRARKYHSYFMVFQKK